MKTQISIIEVLFLIASMGIASADEQAAYNAHLAWKAAFENADIAEVNKIWSHAADTTLITLGGIKKDGWQKIQAELLLSFQLIGETQVSESDLFITLSGNIVSATLNYRWSPIPDIPLFAVKRYRNDEVLETSPYEVLCLAITHLKRVQNAIDLIRNSMQMQPRWRAHCAVKFK